MDARLLPFMDMGDEFVDNDEPGDAELNESFIFDDVEIVELLHDSNVFKVGLDESMLFINDDDDDCKLLLLFPIEMMLCGLCKSMIVN